MNKRPNFLIIVVDCLRADRCPGEGEQDQLKCWPRLRDQGTNFNQMISVASTTPVCFASLFTGQYPFTHGLQSMRGYSLPAGIPTLAEQLNQSGYHTYAFVTGPMVDTYGLDRGFDLYQHRSREQTIYMPSGQALLKRLTSGELNDPWFAVLHLFEIHRPPVLNGAPDPKKADQRYDVAWRQLDEQLDTLTRSLPANTVIMLTADHGESMIRRSSQNFMSHVTFKMRKYLRLPRRKIDWKHHGFFVYEELIRIPFVISGPNIPQGQSITDLVRQIDIMPTILDLAQVNHSLDIDGESMVPYMFGDKLPDRAAFLQTGWMSNDPQRSWHGLRDKKWKYVERPRYGPCIDLEPTLFDLENDPHEEHNVIYKYPQVALDMRQALDQIVYGSYASHTSGENILSDQENQLVEDRLKELGYM